MEFCKTVRNVNYCNQHYLNLFTIFMRYLQLFFEKQFFSSNRIEANDLAKVDIFLRTQRYFSYTFERSSNDIYAIIDTQYKPIILEVLSTIHLKPNEETFLEKMTLVIQLFECLNSVYEFGMIKVAQKKKNLGPFSFLIQPSFVKNSIKVISQVIHQI